MSASNHNNNTINSPIITTPPPPATLKPTSETNHLKDQINHVVDIMQSNVERLTERGESLSSMQQRTQIINKSSIQFRKRTASIRRRLWWQNVKMNLLLLGVFLLVMALITVALVFTIPKKHYNHQNNGPNAIASPPPSEEPPVVD